TADTGACCAARPNAFASCRWRTRPGAPDLPRRGLPAELRSGALDEAKLATRCRQCIARRSGPIARMAATEPLSVQARWTGSHDQGQRDAFAVEQHAPLLGRWKFYGDLPIRQRITPGRARRERNLRDRRLQVEQHFGVIAVAIALADPI